MKAQYLTQLVMCTLLLGCVVPPEIAFKTQDTPENKDKEVRFHTVYYFRVLDTCLPPQAGRLNNALSQPENPQYILSDTLYRFRMVGKSNAYFVKAKFEAGTLNATQIDPFGNSLQTDSNGNFSLVSTQQQQYQQTSLSIEQQLLSLNAKIDKTNQEITLATSRTDLTALEKTKILEILIASLMDLYAARTEFNDYLYPLQSSGDEVSQVDEEKLAGLVETTFPGIPASSKTEIVNELVRNVFLENKSPLNTSNKQLNDIFDYQKFKKEGGINYKDEFKDLEKLKNSLSNFKVKDVTKPKGRESGVCPPGNSRNRGFLIFGPEGWRSFNQDERLILAMYSDASPLIETLSKYSQRMSDARVNSLGSQAHFTDALLEMYKSQQTLPDSKALADCNDQSDKDKCVEAKLDLWIQQFEGGN